MICRKCGANIDTTIRAADGSVQCHSCGTVYRPKNANIQPASRNETPVNYAQPVIQDQQNNALIQQNNTQEQRHRRTAQDYPGQTSTSRSNQNQPFLKKKFLSLPIWAWLCAVLMISGGMFAILTSPRDNISMNSQAVVQSPSQNVSPDSNSVLSQNGDYTVLEYRDEYTDYDVAHRETYSILTGNQFSEGRAWVSFMDNNVKYFAFINDLGEILYKFNPLDQGYISSNSMVFYPCKNGWTCYYEESGIGNLRNGFGVIDKDGNEVFNSKRDKSSTYFFLGFGDTAIVYLKVTESFSESKSELFSLNMKGESTFVSNNRTDSNSQDRFTYLGDSVFAREVHIRKSDFFLDTMEIYNCKTNSLFELGKVIQDPDNANLYAPRLTIPFYNGYSVEKYHGIPVPSSVLIDKQSADSYFSKSNISISEFGMVEEKYYGEGLYYLSSKKGWVDLKGNIVVKMPSFPDSVTIDSVGRFSGGYAIIVMRGADKKHYVTAINTEGEMQYEPVNVPSYTYNNSFGPTLEPSYYCNGNFYLSTSGNQILACNGKLLNINSDDLGIVGKESVFTIDNGLISDGYILHHSTKTSSAYYESLNHEQFIDYIYEYN